MITFEIRTRSRWYGHFNSQAKRLTQNNVKTDRNGHVLMCVVLNDDMRTYRF